MKLSRGSSGSNGKKASVTSRRLATFAAAGLIAISGLNGSASASDESLRFRGVGVSRQALDAMQLKPFDTALWSSLSDWAGEAPTPESTKDKVVLIVTWASWHKVSHPAMRLSQSLATKFKDQGLVVVGVHNPRDFQMAAANAKELGVSFPYAADADGKFRQALKCDLDPNLYLIDRAGQVRFAQIEAGSAEAAIQMLLKESSDQAKSIPGTLAATKAQAQKDRYKTGELADATPPVLMNVKFAAPDEEAYKKVVWPRYRVGKIEEDKILEKIYVTPPKLTLPEEGWAPSKPNAEGRLVAMYIFDPKDTPLLNVLPTMNLLATRYQRDLVVWGAGAKIGEKVIGLQGEELNKMLERNNPGLQSLLAAKRVNHFLTPVPGAIEGGESEIPLYGKTRAESGTVMLLSSDRKIRWQGDPYSPAFKRAIDELIELDPGVQARRKAEDALKGK